MATSFMPLNGAQPRLEHKKIPDSIGGEYVRAVLGQIKTEYVVSSLNNYHPESVLADMWNTLVEKETAINEPVEAVPEKIVIPQTTTHLAFLRSALQACTREGQVQHIQHTLCPGTGCRTRRNRAAQNAINNTLMEIQHAARNTYQD